MSEYFESFGYSSAGYSELPVPVERRRAFHNVNHMRFSRDLPTLAGVGDKYTYSFLELCPRCCATGCRMQVSAEAVAERDLHVFQRCRTAGVPVCMLLSGGYAAASAAAVTASVAAILEREKQRE